MGRHTKFGQPEDEPGADADASRGPSFGTSSGPPFDFLPGTARDGSFSPSFGLSTGPQPGTPPALSPPIGGLPAGGPPTPGGLSAGPPAGLSSNQPPVPLSAPPPAAAPRSWEASLAGASPKETAPAPLPASSHSDRIFSGRDPSDRTFSDREHSDRIFSGRDHSDRTFPNRRAGAGRTQTEQRDLGHKDPGAFDSDPGYADRVHSDRMFGEPPSSGSDSESAQPRSLAKLFSKLPVPLLPIVALVVAVGVIAYAMSTQQISLNFAGGAPKQPQSGAKDSQVSQRGPGQRPGRGGRADGLVIGFRVVSKTPTTFKATATIANRGTQPVARWALTFSIPNVTVRTISGGAAVVRTGQSPFVRGLTATPSIAPGRSVRFVFTATGTPRRPTTCVLNRLPCAFV